jgi:hypothetical protein
MQQEECSICKTIVPQGAIVCSGCHAEKRFGCSKKDLHDFGIIGVFVGILLSYSLSFNPFLFIMTLGAGGLLAMAAGAFLNRNKVVWKRRRRTDY